MSEQSLMGQLHDSLNNIGGPDTTTTTKDTSSSSTINTTTSESAVSQLDKEMMALFGRRATKAESSALVKSLNAVEKRYSTHGGSTTINRATGSTTSSGTNNPIFDSAAFIGEYAVSLATNYVATGKELGGNAAKNYNALLALHAENGVAYDPKTAIRDTISIIKGKTDIEAVNNNVRTRAMRLYAGLAEQMKSDPNLTVKVAAQDYMQSMASMLDIPVNQITLYDHTVQKALNAKDSHGKPTTMNLNDFQNSLRDDHRFQKSSMAKTEAVNLATTMATAFGFGG